MPTNFNLKAFRAAVGSAARVSVHKRNLRKMTLVAVDFDRRPEASPASTPPQSSPATPTTPSPVGPSYQQTTLFASLSSSSEEEEQEEEGEHEQERDTDGDEDFESDSNDSYVHSRDAAGEVLHVAGARAKGLEDFAAPVGSPLLPQVAAVLGAQLGAGERGAGEEVRSTLLPWHDDGSADHSCAHDGAEPNRQATTTVTTKAPTSTPTMIDNDGGSLGCVESVIPAAAAAAIGGDSSGGRPPQPPTLGPESPEVGYAAAGARKMLKEMLGLDTSGDDHHSGDGGGGGGITAALVGMQATTGSGVNLAADLVGVRNKDVTMRTGLRHAECNIDGNEGVRGRDVAQEGGGRQAAAAAASVSAATDAVETRRLLKSLLGLEL